MKADMTIYRFQIHSHPDNGRYIVVAAESEGRARELATTEAIAPEWVIRAEQEDAAGCDRNYYRQQINKVTAELAKTPLIRELNEPAVLFTCWYGQ
jgi:hypothetical protein